ncbi:RNA-directed DNA polymerase, eukaryota, reverse transcriptase zinc-binding domain protein [Tanacetum coccineum]
MGSQRSKEDAVQKISTSVFVTNFPDHFNAKDLRNACKQYGYVVDAFIPNRRSKAGKRFDFVHFIKVFDVERLVNNLCTVWIGRHKIHANVARFQRASLNNSSNQFRYNGENGNNINDVSKDKGIKGYANSYAHVVKGPQLVNVEVESGFGLKQMMERLLLDKMKCGQKIHSTSMTYLTRKKKTTKMVLVHFLNLQQASNEFTIDGRVTWVELEGVPLRMWSENTFKRIASKWGVLLHVDDQEERSSWLVPDFVEQNDEENDSDDGIFEGEPNGEILKNCEESEGDSEIDVVPDTMFEEESHKTNGGEASVGRNKMRASAGNSGGIICVWDSNLFKKLNANVSDYFVMIRGHWVPNGEVIIMGDFNEVRNKTKRFGSVFNVQGANAFNLFISRAGLEEVPLGGCSFTWCHKSATKMSKLDRFLISESLMSSCPNISAITLDRYLSDHRPILLRESKYNYGPIPFLFFHYWFEVDCFEKLVEEIWTEAPMDVSNAMLNLMKKLKYLKKKIRAWNNDMRKSSKNSKLTFKAELSELDAVIDKGEDGIWIDTPALVKNEFLSHFKNQFEKPQEARLNLNMDFPCNLTLIQQFDLETELIENDVVDDVKYFFQHGSIPKGCNSSFIALIPKTPDAKMVKDFKPISLIGSLYKIIAKILANRRVVVLRDIVNEVQSTFVTDRQILDGSFILNELFQWCKSKKKHSLIFKVDFEKAYYSVRWDYLDDILKKFGFGDRWCGWIQGCLRSSWGSVMVNGSITLGPSMQISHMFYADDAIFVGQWSDSNIDIIVHVLNCFYRASGLRINMSKSKLIGISVEEEKVDQAASKIGCVTLMAPFSYLGSKVGGLMSRIQSWNEIVDFIFVRLSKWKMKTLLIGGRLTLLKFIKAIYGDDGKIGKNSKSAYPYIWLDIVHEIELFKKQVFGRTFLARLGTFKHRYQDYKALESCKSIDVAAKIVHTSMDYSFRRIPRGGVEQTQFADLLIKVEGVSLVNMNDRWVWSLEGSGDFSVASVRKLIDDKRLPEVSSKTRWIKSVLIKVNVHAWKVRLDCLPTRINFSRRGVIQILESLRSKFFNGHESSGKKASYGGLGTALKLKELEKVITPVVLTSDPDSWSWTLNNSGGYTVASSRNMIDSRLLPKGDLKTRWIRYVPNKVNTFAWKVMTNSLPTRFKGFPDVV